MQSHIKLLGILYIVYHAVGLLFAWIIWGVLSGVGMMSGDPTAAGILTIVGTVIATLLFALSAPGLIGGIGVLKGWWWARWLVLILGFFNLVNVPLGTILGVYTFWVLMQEETVQYFEADRQAGGMVEPPA